MDWDWVINDQIKELTYNGAKMTDSHAFNSSGWLICIFVYKFPWIHIKNTIFSATNSWFFFFLRKNRWLFYSFYFDTQNDNYVFESCFFSILSIEKNVGTLKKITQYFHSLVFGITLNQFGFALVFGVDRSQWSSNELLLHHTRYAGCLRISLKDCFNCLNSKVQLFRFEHTFSRFVVYSIRFTDETLKFTKFR